MNIGDPLEWYFDIPIVSRVYFTASVLTTALCALDIVSPFTLYFNHDLILGKFQLWRLVTNFLFFGSFSLDFMFHMYFLIRYCRLLEDNSFRGRTADFAFLLLYGALCMILVAPFINIPFLGSALTFMMVYIWGRRNPHLRMNFLGLFPFTAPYLPWVLFGFSFLLGNSPTVDILGIAVGHGYYYFDDVYPEVARLRGWPVKHYLRAPEFVTAFFGGEVIPPFEEDNPEERNRNPQQAANLQALRNANVERRQNERRRDSNPESNDEGGDSANRVGNDNRAQEENSVN